MINKTEHSKRKITSEELKDTLNRVKLALALSGLMGGTIVGANAAENTKHNDSMLKGKTEVVTGHLNDKYMQTTIEGSQEHITQENNTLSKDYKSTLQSVYNLNDGYTMVSSRADAASISLKDGKKDFSKKQLSDVLYMTTPDGRTLDCSFLQNEKNGSILPLGFEKNTFVKEDGTPDKELEAKTINEVKETVGVDYINDDVTKKYNDIVIAKQLSEAKEHGFTDQDISKLKIYCESNKEFIESGKTHILSTKNQIEEQSASKTKDLTGYFLKTQNSR